MAGVLSRKPILVTGSHRSGSTWVGRMIAQSPSVGYIHEPFNINHRPGICGAKFGYWFTYVSQENESNVYEHLHNTISFSYNLGGELREVWSAKDFSRLQMALTEWARFLTCRISRARPLIKDPIAVFSAEWLASRFDMDAVVLIRHPAAFASSLKRLGWTHPFSHFQEQPLLMRDHLHPFAEEIREFAAREHDIVDQATLLWRLIYHVILNYQKNHTDWLFVRHEDLSRDPIGGFQDIFERLNLELSEDTRRVIREHSDSSNPVEVPITDTSRKRDSRASIWNWKDRLTESEIGRIREQVEDVSNEFYSESDW